MMMIAGYRIMFTHESGFHKEPGCERVHTPIPEHRQKWELCSEAMGEAWLDRKRWANENCYPPTDPDRTMMIQPVYVKLGEVL